MASSSLLLLALGGLVGCGGEVAGVGGDVNPGGPAGGTTGGGGGTTGGSGGGSGGGTTTSLDVEGSYDLELTQATATYQGGSGVPASPSPSSGRNARLDIRSEKSNGTPAYSAVLTPRWGMPADYTVSLSDTQVVLDSKSGASIGSASTSFPEVSDTWQHITLERGSDGKLTGVVHASGQEQIIEGDEIWQGDLVGAGKMGVDVTKPEVRARLTSPAGPSNALLPWDTIETQLAEPLDATSTEKTTSIVVDDFSLPVSWKLGAPPSSSSVGSVLLEGTLTSWTAARGASIFVHDGGVSDPSGNVSSQLNSPFTFLSLPQAQNKHIFGANSVPSNIAPWGGAKETVGAHCESGGGCLQIGPFTHQGCGASRMGAAGLLTGPATLPPMAPKVHVRYRVLAEPTFVNGAPEMFDAPFVIQTAIPGGFVQETEAGRGPTGYTQLSSPIDGMNWATAWTTVDIAPPTGGSFPLDSVGFALRAGGLGMCGGPPMPANQVEILIDSVWLQ